MTNIYALGDCVELKGQVMPFVMPLMHQAKALAKTLAGNATTVVYPVMPLSVKTPVCPIAAVIPPPGTVGDWQVETTSPEGVRALFYTPDKIVSGFALSGEAVAEKNSLIKLVAATLPDATAAS